jgi:agmatine deiminase
MSRATNPTTHVREAALRDLRDLGGSVSSKKRAHRRDAEHAEVAQRRRGQEHAANVTGFRMPAEWEPHEATWLGWPHNRSDWPGKFAMIPWVYGEIVRKLAPGEILRMIVNDKRHEESARRTLLRTGVDLGRVEFFRFPTNRGWTRDFGPMFIKREGKQREVAIARFRFNGWAKYPDFQKDDQVPVRAARALGCRLLRASAGTRDFVLEGGGIDVNGLGTLLTTEECFLDQTTQVRNPGLSRRQIEAALCRNLGVTNIVWLGRGIEGDDTH